MFKSIYIFYVMKFAPKIIDSNSIWFWQMNVRLLNKLRNNHDGFQLWKAGRLSIRDPHSYPMKSHFSFARKFHPFVWEKSND